MSEKEAERVIIRAGETLSGYYAQRLEAHGLIGRDPTWKTAPADFYVHHQKREGAGHCVIQAVGPRFKVTHILAPHIEGHLPGFLNLPEVGRFDSFEEAAATVRQVLDAELAAVRLAGGHEPVDCHACGGDGNASDPAQPCYRCDGSGIEP